MSRYAVDLAELSLTVDRLGAFANELEEALRATDSQANRLHAEWTGAAAAEHRAAHAEWRRGVADMREALATMRRAAQAAHTNYSNAIAANTRMWAL